MNPDSFHPTMELDSRSRTRAWDRRRETETARTQINTNASLGPVLLSCGIRTGRGHRALGISQHEFAKDSMNFGAKRPPVIEDNPGGRGDPPRRERCFAGLAPTCPPLRDITVLFLRLRSTCAFRA